MHRPVTLLGMYSIGLSMMQNDLYARFFTTAESTCANEWKQFQWLLTEDYSSTLAWKIPWAEEPGGLQSMGSLRVGHD